MIAMHFYILLQNVGIDKGDIPDLAKVGIKHLCMSCPNAL